LHILPKSILSVARAIAPANFMLRRLC